MNNHKADMISVHLIRAKKVFTHEKPGAYLEGSIVIDLRIVIGCDLFK